MKSIKCMNKRGILSRTVAIILILVMAILIFLILRRVIVGVFK